MFQTFRNAWKIPELRNRLLFTLAILVVYRLGCAIPVPFITGSALSQMFSNSGAQQKLAEALGILYGSRR